MTLKVFKKKTVGVLALGLVIIILVIIIRIDWLGYKAVDTAKNKCMMAYLNLKQVVLDLPADEDELFEFVEDECSTIEGKLHIPAGGIWIWQARFWKSQDGKWFWQNYERQRTINQTLVQRLTHTTHLIEAKMGEAIKEKREKQDRWEAMLAEIKAASTISTDDNNE